MGMWHFTQKVALLLGLFLKGIIQRGGGQGGGHKVDGRVKSMLPVGSYLVMEGSRHGDLHKVITGPWCGRDVSLGLCPQCWIDIWCDCKYLQATYSHK